MFLDKLSIVSNMVNKIPPPVSPTAMYSLLAILTTLLFASEKGYANELAFNPYEVIKSLLSPTSVLIAVSFSVVILT
jgi:hypothetical protein